MNPHLRKTFRASDKYKAEELLSHFLRLPPEEREGLFPPPCKVAKIVGKDKRTIGDWIVFDKIAGIKVGERERRVYWPSVLEYLRWLQDKGIAAEDTD